MIGRRKILRLYNGYAQITKNVVLHKIYEINILNNFISFISFIFALIIKSIHMESFSKMNKPSKDEQKVAIESYDALASVINELRLENPEIKIEETKERIKIPLRALKLLSDILQAMSQGKLISIVPNATEVTTQKAAEMLGCSRPHFVKLLEEGKIEYTKVGKHRRVKYDDVVRFKKKMKEEQKQRIIDMMRSDEDLGLYDSQH